MKSCHNCKHGDVSPFKPPCDECFDAGLHGNWEPVEGTVEAKVKEFLDNCDELDAAIYTGDILLFMNHHERMEFMDFLTSWFKKFAQISCNEKEEMEKKK
jgi:hypothetical protein